MSSVVPFYFHRQRPYLRFFTAALVQHSLSTLIQLICKRRLRKGRLRIRTWGKLV
jgi:hypothetical protein